MAVWPPSLVNSFLSWVLPPSSEPMPLAAAPDAAKMNATPAIQPPSTPRCNRQARLSGPRSRPEALARPGRSGSSPAPRSRRAARA